MDILIENLCSDNKFNQNNVQFIIELINKFNSIFNHIDTQIKFVLIDNYYCNNYYISPYQFNNLSFCNIYSKINNEYIFSDTNEIFINLDKLNNNLFLNTSIISTSLIYMLYFIFESGFNLPIHIYDISGDINDIIKIIKRINFKYGDFAKIMKYGMVLANNILLQFKSITY